MTEYLINYDNGVNDCGTFPWAYTDYDKACRDADDIMDENIIDGSWGEDGYCEVILKPTTVIDDGDFHEDVVMGWAANPLPHEIEGTIDHFDRYIAGDR